MFRELTWFPAEPAVDEALCASFELLVSVENPESCMTLPFPSPPLFGSFLPLCELLRLRLSSDDDWMSPAPLPSLLPLLSFRRTRIPGSHSRRETIDDDCRPVVLFAPDVAILCLRSGKVSMTKSRNSSKAPTSFCSSWSDLVWSVWWWKLVWWWTRLLRWLYGPWAGVRGITSMPASNVHSSVWKYKKKIGKNKKICSKKISRKTWLEKSMKNVKSLVGYQERESQISSRNFPCKTFFSTSFAIFLFFLIRPSIMTVIFAFRETIKLGFPFSYHDCRLHGVVRELRHMNLMKIFRSSRRKYFLF